MLFLTFPFDIEELSSRIKDYEKKLNFTTLNLSNMLKSCHNSK